MERGADGYVYGLYGTHAHRHLEAKITQLLGGARTVLVPSGQAANTLTMLTVLTMGDRVLLPDTCYGPTHDFAQKDLAQLGIQAEFYDPLDLGELEARAVGAKLIWAESPPLDHGVDLVAEALSKHFGSHSDILMGAITVADPELPACPLVGRSSGVDFKMVWFCPAAQPLKRKPELFCKNSSLNCDEQRISRASRSFHRQFHICSSVLPMPSAAPASFDFNPLHITIFLRPFVNMVPTGIEYRLAHIGMQRRRKSPRSS